ncbi:Get4 protein [Saccharomycopsis crataegensis]|uniref:Get4 protein n=1 Tax=Saccharomycopsis crataegensis TaxID=43959 RepID=A0AAV5QWL2_9ASCO|nr:Get4 protein [Saccharomycopsis crataegensis]
MSDIVANATGNITSSNPKLQRTIARFKAKVAAGDFYEAHQTLRTLINRATKSHQLGHAVDLIYYGSLILVEHSQYASASDLILLLFDILGKDSEEAEKLETSEITNKLITILSKFPANEVSLKKLSAETINWSASNTEYKFGDPKIHDLIGDKYLHNPTPENLTENYVVAMNHLILGTKASFDNVAELVWSWYCDATDSVAGAQVLGIPAVNYAILKNIDAAKKFIDVLADKLQASSAVKELSVDEFCKIRYFEAPELGFLNFIQLAILCIQTGNKDFFVKLKNEYRSVLVGDYKPAVDKLGSVYFNIQAPKQVNFLQEMMSGFLK